MMQGYTNNNSFLRHSWESEGGGEGNCRKVPVPIVNEPDQNLNKCINFVIKASFPWMEPTKFNGSLGCQNNYQQYSPKRISHAMQVYV